MEIPVRRNYELEKRKKKFIPGCLLSYGRIFCLLSVILQVVQQFPTLHRSTSKRNVSTISKKLYPLKMHSPTGNPLQST